MTFSFGEFTLDTACYELCRSGEPVAAEPQVLELLAYLLRHRERIVGKEELLESVWSGRIVSDSAVSRAVREVRRLLGDSAAASRFVKTVYGRGFRFVGEEVREAPTGHRERDPGRGASVTSSQGAGRDSTSLALPPLPRPLTPLVGRERELEESAALLASTRLLTLTGAAGTGKSRLALALAKAMQERFADGSVFVSLAEVTDPAGVASAIARSLGLTDAAGQSALEALHLQLRERQLLLVLDNFEQVLAAAVEVAELLQACPELVAVVTSRFVLGVPGEQELAVPPLALPDRGADSQSCRAASAVALFLARARAALPSFDPDDQELAYVVEICRRLDGLPLALELAASRIKVFPPAALWKRLAGRLDLLSSSRPHRGRPHRTLEEALAWSFELLEDAERTLLRRLAVFSGSFELAAASAICGLGEDDTVELVAALVDKSLVERQWAHHETMRFGLLETTRVFALDRLRECGEEADLRRSHARWFGAIAQGGATALIGGDQRRWLERLDADHPNLLAVLEWSREGGELAAGLAVGAALGRYWSARAAYREGRRELEALLSHPAAAGVAVEVRVDALSALGSLIHLLGDYRAAAERLEEARRLLGEREDLARRAQVLNHLAWVSLQVEPLPEAEALADEALAANQLLADLRGEAVALNNIGQIAFFRGDAEGAEERFRASLARRREAGDARGAAFALANLAMVRLFLGGDLEPVDGWLEEARAGVECLGDPPLAAWIASLSARAEMMRGRPETALTRLRASGFTRLDQPHADGTAWVHLSIGDALDAMGERAAARQEVQRAAEIWGSIESHWGQAVASLRLADLAAQEGRTETAREAYRGVVALADRYGLEGIGAAARQGLTASAGVDREGWRHPSAPR